MCGIAGIYQKRGEVLSDVLRSMADTLRHRGPDFSGSYVSADKTVGLAHARLSIIDLSESANQPMCNEDRKVWLVFNGEIYNFESLRESLIRKGHRFKSKSDSEVILHLYEEKGIDLVNDLNGMFAFCLFDENTDSIYLARDRVGIKPLYYSYKDDWLAFASETKALLKLSRVSREIDLRGLDFYFALGYIPSELSIFKDIRKLKPGHFLEYNGDEIKTVQYWKIAPNKDRVDPSAERDLLDILEEKLRRSVKSQMVSDVPIGCFLSGGLDSSLVAKIMAEEADQPISTFTITFGSRPHDESAFAKIVAHDVRSIHHEYSLRIDATEALERLVYHFDEPFADSSLIPTYYVSKLAREKVTVILSGDGGDELFGGYNWYSWVLRLSKIKDLLGKRSRWLSGLSDLLPDGFKGNRFLSALDLEPWEKFFERVSVFSYSERSRLFADGLRDLYEQKAPEREIRGFFNNIDGDLVDRMTLTDFTYYLPEDILTKVDRASMAVSLETRVPWLDHELAEFAYSLPSKLRINAGEKKYLPKQLAKKMLPRNLSLQRKQGFCVPMDQWMRGELGEVLEEEMNDNNAALARYLNLNYVRDLINRNRNSKKSGDGSKLFSVLFFSMWLRRYASLS